MIRNHDQIPMARISQRFEQVGTNDVGNTT